MNASREGGAGLMLGLLAGGLSGARSLQHAGDQPGRQPDESLPPDGGLGYEGQGWADGL
jgi:hypothetical protein